MSGFANEAYIVVTLNLLSLELKCNNPGKRTVAFKSLYSVTVRFAVAVQATSSWGVNAVAGTFRPVRPVSAGPHLQMGADGRRHAGRVHQRIKEMKQSVHQHHHHQRVCDSAQINRTPQQQRSQRVT